MNSPRRSLQKNTWYFCLLLAVLVTTQALAQSPVLHAHKRHGRIARHGRLHHQYATTGSLLYQPLYEQPTLAETAPRLHAFRSTVHHVNRLRTAHHKHIVAVPVVSVLAPTAVEAPLLRAPAPTTIASPVAITTPSTPAPNATVPVVAPKALAAAPSPKPVSSQNPILAMTRDASSTLSGISGQPLHDAGRLDVTQQIVRMLAALLVVLLLILGSVKLLRRMNIVPTVDRSHPMNGGGRLASQLNRAIASSTKKNNVAMSDSSADFTLLSSLKLPGSAASLHLVQAASRTLLLSAGGPAGVTILSDVSDSGEERVASTSSATPLLYRKPDAAQENVDTSVAAFADILREKAGLAPLGVRHDVLALERIDSRLSETQERISTRMRSGAQISTAISNLGSAVTRRRRTKSPQSKVGGL